MNFEQLLLSKRISVNLLSKQSGIPRTTILDMARGRSDVRKASGITLYKISKALGVSIEYLIELDTVSDLDTSTGKPVDKSYYEYSLNEEMTRALRNLKNSINSNNELKQSYWKELIMEEMTSLRRKDEIGIDAYEYFYNRYLKGDELND